MASDPLPPVLVHEEQRAVRGLYADRLAADESDGPRKALVVRAAATRSRRRFLRGALGHVCARFGGLRSVVGRALPGNDLVIDRHRSHADDPANRINRDRGTIRVE